MQPPESGDLPSIVAYARGETPALKEFPAHPQFRRARSEFDDRWASDLGEYQDYEYVQALSQMAETFLSGYRLLRDRAGNDVTAVQRARATYKELDHVIDEEVGRN